MAWTPFAAALLLTSLTVNAVPSQKGTGDNDLVTSLPGLTFEVKFKHYAGFLNATDNKNFFYWFTESQNDPSKDPVVLWLNGGPGCSSLGGLLTELGPFHPNSDGKTLFENVFSWNKFANVIFLESPSGVGFSYSSPKNDTATDDLTAYHNFHALRDFFYNKFPEYQNRDFYVTGESYAGVYIPTLTKQIIDGIARNEFPNNFKGIAIGNGILSGRHQFNSVIHLMYYHGIVGADEWNALLDACCPNVSSDKCDFYAAVQLPHSQWTKCSQLANDFGNGHNVNDEYNMYQDCYDDVQQPQKRANAILSMKNRFKSGPKTSSLDAPLRKLAPGTKDMSHQINYDSTDADLAFQCWADERIYLNSVDVKKALHIPEERWNHTWCSCCNIPYYNTYNDMADVFSYIIKNSNIRILIYNGDVDLVCNFLGDQWFIEREVVPQNKLNTAQDRKSWTYRNQVAGFVKRFDRLDLLTVKGSGHFVPQDRGGPALQMIANFIRNEKDYSKATGIDVKPKPVKPTF